MSDTAQQERRSALDEFAALSSEKAPTIYQPLPAAEQFGAHGSIEVFRPRDEAKVLQRIKTLAAAMGQEWFYRYPVKNRRENRTDWIEGPSIKLANDLCRIYGNCEVDCRTRDMGEFWEITARFIDLENGFAITRPFQQRKSAARLGGDDDGRRLEIALSIGVSKAERNVVVNALQSFADFAFEEARNSLVERIGKELPAWRARTIEKVSAKVALNRVEAVIGRAAADWLAPDVAQVIALMKGVADGMATLEETFPPLAASAQVSDNSASKALDAFTASGANAGASPGPDASTSSAPRSSEHEGQDTGAAGQGEASESKPTPEPAADLFSEIERRMAAAPSPEALDAIWEQMDLDAKLDGDAEGRSRANKIMAKRQRELKK